MGRSRNQQFYVEIGYFVLYPVIPHRRLRGIGQAPEAIEINAVFYVRWPEKFQNGGTDQLMGPSDQLALSVEGGLIRWDAGARKASFLSVVFSSPYYLYRLSKLL